MVFVNNDRCTVLLKPTGTHFGGEHDDLIFTRCHFFEFVDVSHPSPEKSKYIVYEYVYFHQSLHIPSVNPTS